MGGMPLLSPNQQHQSTERLMDASFYWWHVGRSYRVYKKFSTILWVQVRRPTGLLHLPIGRPRTTWLRTINDDLQFLNFRVHTAWRKARDRDVWHQVISMATLHWRSSPIQKKKKSEVKQESWRVSLPPPLLIWHCYDYIWKSIYITNYIWSKHDEMHEIILYVKLYSNGLPKPSFFSRGRRICSKQSIPVRLSWCVRKSAAAIFVFCTCCYH